MFTVEEECECELITALEVKLKELERGEVKIYFSGEFDGNQTKFESLSNHLEVGVIAPNKITGLVLLRLVRIIIDENTDLLMDDCFCVFTGS